MKIWPLNIFLFVQCQVYPLQVGADPFGVFAATGSSKGSDRYSVPGSRPELTGVRCSGKTGPIRLCVFKYRELGTFFQIIIFISIEKIFLSLGSLRSSLNCTEMVYYTLTGNYFNYIFIKSVY